MIGLGEWVTDIGSCGYVKALFHRSHVSLKNYYFAELPTHLFGSPLGHVLQGPYGTVPQQKVLDFLSFNIRS